MSVRHIGIVTVFYSTNCGSILQAAALQEAYGQLGCNCSFISTINKISALSSKKCLKDALKAITHGLSPFPVMRKYRDIQSFVKKTFRVVGDQDVPDLDLISIGSDTVWDITSKYFLASQDVFWCLPWNPEKVVTYAASIANSPYVELDRLEYPVRQLSRYRCISVRDEYTAEYVRSRTGRNVVKVCDPTLLMGKEFYLQWVGSKPLKPYLLLYLFNDPEPSIALEIKSYAKARDLEIVSLGKRLSIADLHIESSVEHFLTYFAYAEAVVTNTFHGTVFSLIFERQFAVLDYKKKKIENLLSDLQLSQRIVSSGLAELLDSPVFYGDVEAYFLQLRGASLDYLKACVEDL